MIAIDYLVTTLRLNVDEIVFLIDKNKIHGNVIVGNQGMPKNQIFSIKTKNSQITIVDQTSLGVSKNRNTIMAHSKADYITFLDDDTYFVKNGQETLEKIIAENPDENAIRFNVVSDNIERPIPQIENRKRVKFKSMSAFGVLGIVFKRSSLSSASVTFPEDIGPGTRINHGEDALFLYFFLKKYKTLLQVNCCPLHAKQEESTWYNDSVETTLYAHGYNYYTMFTWKAPLFAAIFIARHRDLYPGFSYSQLVKFMLAGINDSKKERKRGQ